MAGITTQVESVKSAETSSDGVTETSTLVFLMPWSDRFTFIDDLLPHTLTTETGVLFVPGSEYPGRPGVRAVSASIVGIKPTTAGSTAEFELAKITVKYETTIVTSGDTSVISAERTEEGQAQLEVLQVSGFGYRWDTDDKEIDATEDNPEVAITIPTVTLRITESRLTTLPWTSITSLLGSVNNTSFLGASAGKVLYIGSSFNSTQQVPLAGTPTPQALWTASHAFRVRAIPHNYFLRKNGGWQKIYSGATTAKQFVYPEADLSPLLVTGTSFNPG